MTTLSLVLQGAVVQIMGVPSNIWSEHLPSLKWHYPPAAFVHMTRDARTAAVVADDVAALSKAGIPSVEIRVEPAAMTPATFSETIEEVRNAGTHSDVSCNNSRRLCNIWRQAAACVQVDMQTSERIYGAFKDGDMLDANDRLQRDPR